LVQLVSLGLQDPPGNFLYFLLNFYLTLEEEALRGSDVPLLAKALLPLGDSIRRLTNPKEVLLKKMQN
jgi:hypothetical protein